MLFGDRPSLLVAEDSLSFYLAAQPPLLSKVERRVRPPVHLGFLVPHHAVAYMCGIVWPGHMQDRAHGLCRIRGLQTW